MSEQKGSLDISWGTIIKIALGALAFYIVYLVKDILVWFIFALIISVLFDPAITFLHKLRIPRILSVAFIYIAIFGILGLTIYMMAPAIFTEIQQFSQLFPQYFEKIASPLRGLGIEAFTSLESFTQALGATLQKASSNIFSALALFFGSIGSTFFILSIALFLSSEEKGIEKTVTLLAPRRYESYVLSLWKKTEAKVAGWFGSKLLACLFVGVAVFVTLYLFNAKYALSLSFLSAILNFIPIIGPVIAAILAFIFLALDSWMKAVFFTVAFILIQQIEGAVISPILTKKFVGLPPVLVLLSVAIGGKLLGVLGAVLAIPMFGIIFEFLKDFLARRKQEVRTVE